MPNSIMYVGLDVHKDSIDVALAEEGRSRELRHYGKIGGDFDALDKVVRKLSGTGKTLHFVYEARPCGYALYRHLTGQGYSCSVIAPSKTPRGSGDRVKTDRRDSVSLARLERAGELTPVFVPREDDEAMRDLTRAREDAVRAERRARQTLGLPVAPRHSLHWSKRMDSPAPALALRDQALFTGTTGRLPGVSGSHLGSG